MQTKLSAGLERRVEKEAIRRFKHGLVEGLINIPTSIGRIIMHPTVKRYDSYGPETGRMRNSAPYKLGYKLTNYPGTIAAVAHLLFNPIYAASLIIGGNAASAIYERNRNKLFPAVNSTVNKKSSRKYA